MKIVAVDDEAPALANALMLLERVAPDAERTGFRSVQDALAYCVDNPVDVALLDVRLGDVDGVELARRCRQRNPRCNVVFVTAYPDYALDAYGVRASGYLVKPLCEDDLRAEFDSLRFAPYMQPARVRVQAFGAFEVFVDGAPLRFPLAKCKECLAYLVDRHGACVSFSALASVLWEDRIYDRPTQNSMHQVVHRMIGALRDAGVDDIVLRRRDGMAVDVSKVECDYYRALDEGRLPSMFMGEYMANYSWAESTLGELLRR